MSLTSKLEEGKVSEQCTEYKDTLQGNFWHPPYKILLPIS